MYNKKGGDDAQNYRTSFIKIVHRWHQFLLCSLDPSFFLAKVCSYVSSHFLIYYTIESISIMSICQAIETDLTGGCMYVYDFFEECMYVYV